ncbi:protein DELAY OF GERMINATION 1-like [Argentina anserina]|uniref:protein DELAY OF GERMINATION 1-like n=1 Tax=Argentina anserina TaxID=57926 RepID=UPI0021766B76|nr:protein DELAY OF GERMINATION 1-like [Potentilla anserina]
MKTEHECPETFFEAWLSEQNQDLHHLTNVAADHNHGNSDDSKLLGALVDQVVKHYESYYEAKSRWAEHNVLTMLSPPWTSTLENAFFWIGGWRPSMSFHLLYSKSGLQLEAQLAEMMRGFSTTDLSDLSHSQLAGINNLQGGVIKQEKHINHKMAKLQDTIADTTMVELSHLHVAAEMVRKNGHKGRDDVDDHGDLVESTLSQKQKGLEEILHRADELRLRTLKNITCILTPIQAVHFLIAAAELHLKLHDWGKKMDASGQVVGA